MHHSLSSVAQAPLRFARNFLHSNHSRQSLIMACSPVQLAKRALVTLLLTFARQYAMPALPLSRDSPDKVVLESFKKVAKKGRAENRTEKTRKGRRRKGKETQHGGGNPRHASSVPLARPSAPVQEETASAGTQRRAKSFAVLSGRFFPESCLGFRKQVK